MGEPASTIGAVSAKNARANLIIAGVNKAGTTSLFVSLATHPDVATASVKETRYFLPARYGQPLEPVSRYESYFADAGDRPVRLEATPAYFYGGAPLVERVVEICGDARIVVSFREPVSRLVSFFTYQKTRLRIPESLSFDQYVARADSLGPADFADPRNEPYFGLRGGYYADFLPPWQEAFGARLRIIFFDELVADPQAVLRDLAKWLEIEPYGFQGADLSSENRTTGFRVRALQRAAIAFNDRLERFLRRHLGLKQRLRSVYYRLNGRAMSDAVRDEVRAALRERYREPNARLARMLHDADVTALPAWLPSVAPAGVATEAAQSNFTDE
jgi:hypothetical protein